MTPTEIHKARTTLGMTADSFAAALGFTGANRQTTVYRWERNRRRPDARAISAIRRLLKTHSRKTGK